MTYLPSHPSGAQIGDDEPGEYFPGSSLPGEKLRRYERLVQLGVSYASGLLFGLFLVLAWSSRGLDVKSPILGWLASFALVVYRFNAPQRFGPMILAGIITYAGGFSWLYNTIHSFGGFDSISAGAIFGLFVVVSALQFVVFTFLIRQLPSKLSALALTTPVAWVATEGIFPRIFPWSLAHTQLELTKFVQVADILGTNGITFVLLWSVEALYGLVSGVNRRFLVIFGILSPFASLWYGEATLSRNLSENSQKIAVIQANISLREKHDPESIEQIFTTYREMSNSILSPDTLIIWPETAITDWIPTSIVSSKQHHLLATLPHGAQFLVGGLTFDSPEVVHNSALAITADSQIYAPYHKRILMPFGEYTPGTGQTFPASLLPVSVKEWLSNMNATAGNFSPGTAPSVFKYPILANSQAGPGHLLSISPLICYEDVIPEMAREAVNAGAELLVNMSNDAWFGRSAAPYQHHRIASFRAIENKRSLIRATNSGLSAVVDPYGRTLSQLPIFKPGTLIADVKLIGYNTIYTKYDIEMAWWWLNIGVLIIALLNLIRSAFRVLSYLKSEN